MLGQLRLAAKYAFAPILYRFPPIGLQPSELGIYLQELLNRSSIPGDIAEIGCSVGGTACLAAALVKKYSPTKNYICYDTFNGFVKEQIEIDISRGTPESAKSSFTGNSLKLVRRILDLHGCREVRLVRGDIVKISDDELSDRYSVVLLDVDLSEPTYYALKRVYPRLSEGGIILIDDCRADPTQRWNALLGYRQFCEEKSLTPQLRYGFGVIEK
jgi:O-methyltransferase